MRRLLGTSAALLLLASPAATAATSVTVSIKSTGFAPQSLSIASGSQVVWKNVDRKSHQIVANDGSFASGVLAPGKSYEFTFVRGGTFRYHDALYPKLTGKIVVKGPPPSLTLALDQPIVVYGTQITLSGRYSSAGTRTVTLFAQEYGASAVQLAVVQTAADGSFSFATTPRQYTTYSATTHVGGPSGPDITSGAVLAQVAPKVQLLSGGNGYMRAQVTAARPFWHRHVFLQRLSRYGQWVSIASLALGPRSGRVFRPSAYVPHGASRIRIFLTVNQAGLGYLASHSGSQRVVRR